MYNELRGKLERVGNYEELKSWLEECDNYLEALTENLNNETVWNKRKKITQIINVKCLRLRAQRRKYTDKRGSGYGEINNDDDDDDDDEEENVLWMDVESTFNSRLTTGMVVNLSHIDPREFLADAFELIASNIVKTLARHRVIKVNTTLFAEFVNSHDESDVKTFNTKNVVIEQYRNIDEWYRDHVVEPILRKMEEFQERDSGWALKRIQNIVININKHEALSAGCAVNVPHYIAAKHAVVNIKTEDNACFAWSVVASLYPARNNCWRVYSYPHYENVLDIKNINFPTKLRDIEQFEKDNDISVNVFTFDESNSTTNKKLIVPLRIAPQLRKHHVNLLYLCNENGHGHYMCIKDLSRLLSSDLSKNEHRKHICHRCLNYFSSATALDEHDEYCSTTNSTRIILPNETKEEEKWMSFKNHKHKQLVPVIVYADFECLLEPYKVEEEKEDDANEPSTSTKRKKKKKKKTAMEMYQRHVPFNIGYYVRNTIDSSKSRYNSYRGLDCDVWFARQIHSIAEEVSRDLAINKPMEHFDPYKHYAEKTCHICTKPFSHDDRIVRDHCHITGKSRGPAHNACNLNFKISHVIPIIFHNLSGYDAHFVIKAIASTFDGRIKVLPLNKERYISFTKYDEKFHVQLRFVDSFKFLASSLDKLTSYLQRDELIIFKSEFNNLNERQLESLMRKGVFPYDFVDSYDKLEGETRLPDRKFFYNKLTDCAIDEEDYDFAKSVWHMFNVKNLGEYSDLYLKTDVLLLADVFENFRKRCMQNYDLDPAHYYTLPGFTWDAMLKHTNIKFELLTDLDMLMMIESSIRGGLC